MAACGLALAACGGGGRHPSRTVKVHPGPAKPQVIDIDSSLPLAGPMASDGLAVMDGMRLALSRAGGRAGPFVVHYRSLDDARAGRGPWDASAVAANARRAATDPGAVLYLGEFDSGASAISIPILNQAGIPQLSPASTAVGLTERVPGASGPDDPAQLYPSGDRTFVRVIPNDAVQAAAELMALRQAGCTHLAVAWTRGGGGYGGELAALLGLQRSGYGMAIVSNSLIDPRLTSLRVYAGTIKARGAQCVAVLGASTGLAAALAEAVHAALPTALIIGPDRICNASWTDFRRGGVPAVVDPYLMCTAPYLSPGAYPGGGGFLAAWKASFGPSSRPGRYAIFGYAAMQIALEAIGELGRGGDDRVALLRGLFDGRSRESALGPLSFDREGDSSLRAYGLYRARTNGTLIFARTLVPPKVYVGPSR